jgi:hypothetical protein
MLAPVLVVVTLSPSGGFSGTAADILIWIWADIDRRLSISGIDFEEQFLVTKVTPELFADFVQSEDTLRVYQDGECVFASTRDVLAPLVEYILNMKVARPVVVLDRVTGNAAALLAIKAGAVSIFSPLGSELAAKTLSEYQIDHYIERVVPFILAANGKDMCPMESLSRGKTPDEFFDALTRRQKAPQDN